MTDASLYSATLCVRHHDLLFHVWSGEDRISVFDSGTGLTHLISGFPAEILAALADRPLSLGALAQVLGDRCDAVVDADWYETVARSVQGLMALELLDTEARCLPTLPL